MATKGTKSVETITLTFTLDAPPATKDRVTTDEVRDYLIEDLDSGEYYVSGHDCYSVTKVTFPDLVGTRVEVDTPEPPVGSKVLAFDVTWERGKAGWMPLHGAVCDRFDGIPQPWKEFLPIGLGDPAYILSYA